MPIAETFESPFRIVREAECRKMTGLSRAQRYKMERAGEFPRRVSLVPGGAHHGWLLGELEEWAQTRAAERANAEPRRPEDVSAHAA